ncbi:universal stress protein [Streptacidiphilus neutrinimicus]|uniref:universal stress protein n=1 Tax=Streptacidiphilus neutrinimicus TaxID=105420 RepID=UPI0005A6BACE|nr:universal stress protein [Streptacidiphilus neutrinimicus]
MYTLLTETRRPGAVLVGVDPSAGAKAALDWAVCEARLRDAPLLIAHSWNHLDYELPEALTRTIGDSTFRAAATFLEDIAAGVRATAPGLKIDTVLLSEAPTDGLISLAENAAVLVVGRRGRGDLLAPLLGSVSHRLVAHAPVPVVVVPHTTTGTAAPAGGTVVVGVAREAPAPVGFAFAEAEAQGAPLLAVRAWTLPSPYTVASEEAAAALDADESAELDTLLADARTMRPAVPVTTRVAFGAPDQVLLEAAADATMIVLGRHRLHHRTGLLLGTVPQRVLHRAEAPVAVVPN